MQCTWFVRCLPLELEHSTSDEKLQVNHARCMIESVLPRLKPES